MKKYRLTKEQLNGVPMYLGFINTESDIIPLYIGNEKKVLKKYLYCDELEDKIYTIEYLEKEKDKFDDRFILPEMLGVNKIVIGYIMNYIENINLETLLADWNIPFSKKIECLKEIGNILEYCKHLRNNYHELSGFYIGDLQVNNFIYNIDTNKINICDLDSCKIGDNEPSSSKYLAWSKGIEKYSHKYPHSDDVYIPNENSDIYCYIMLIMNFLCNKHVELMEIDEFYKYLNYLDSLKWLGKRLFDKELIDIFSKIYTNEDNINPVHLVESISYKALIRARNF